MVFGKLLKLLMAAGLALFAWASTAGAVVISDVEPVPGGPSITDGLITLGLSSSGISISGGATGVAVGGPILPPVPGLLTTGALQITGSLIDGGSFATINPGAGGSLFLSGSFLDAAFDVGVLTVLLSVVGGTAAADFGDFVLLSLASPSLGLDTPNTLPTSPNVELLTNVTTTISSAQLVQQLSAPAVLGLLLPGVGLLLLLSSLGGRARRSASQMC